MSTEHKLEATRGNLVVVRYLGPADDRWRLQVNTWPDDVGGAHLNREQAVALRDKLNELLVVHQTAGMPEQAIPLDESCEHCAAGLVLHTTATQHGDGGWWANDGDRVTCEGCDHVTAVSADEDGGGVQTDVDCGCAACEKDVADG